VLVFELLDFIIGDTGKDVADQAGGPIKNLVIKKVALWALSAMFHSEGLTTSMGNNKGALW
jgi:hypothetical protein